jgi:hypothetical protein
VRRSKQLVTSMGEGAAYTRERSRTYSENDERERKEREAVRWSREDIEKTKARRRRWPATCSCTRAVLSYRYPHLYFVAGGARSLDVFVSECEQEERNDGCKYGSTTEQGGRGGDVRRRGEGVSRVRVEGVEAREGRKNGEKTRRKEKKETTAVQRKTTTRGRSRFDGESESAGQTSGVVTDRLDDLLERDALERRIPLHDHHLPHRSSEIVPFPAYSVRSRVLELLDERRVLLRTLDLVTALDAADSIFRQDIRSAVRMIVNAAVESRSRVAAEASPDEAGATRVLVDEGRNVVDETADDHELTGLAGFLNCAWRIVSTEERREGEEARRTLIPSEDGKVVRRLRPSDLVCSTSDGLELHCVLSLPDIVVGCVK